MNFNISKMVFISKKTTLNVQYTFFVNFVIVVLHDYNVKLPEASLLHVFWRTDVVCVPVNFFFRCRSFSPWWLLEFLTGFLTAAIKISRFSSNKIVSFVFFLSLTLF